MSDALSGTLEIDNPRASCGHCRFSAQLDGEWSVEGGRLVFRAALNPLEGRGPGMESCCESSPVVDFRRITVDGRPLAAEQVAELQASARTD